MLWGCFARTGLGVLCRVDHRLDSEGYVALCNKCVKSSFRKIFKDRRMKGRWFQQDGAPCHTCVSSISFSFCELNKSLKYILYFRAKQSLQWFRDNKIPLMDWPSQSPDLNPIEHLWDEIDRSYRQGPRAKNLNELCEKLQIIWESIPLSTIEKLIDSMPARMRAVVEAKGGYTHY